MADIEINAVAAVGVFIEIDSEVVALVKSYRLLSVGSKESLLVFCIAEIFAGYLAHFV